MEYKVGIYRVDIPDMLNEAEFLMTRERQLGFDVLEVYSAGDDAEWIIVIWGRE